MSAACRLRILRRNSGRGVCRGRRRTAADRIGPFKSPKRTDPTGGSRVSAPGLPVGWSMRRPCHSGRGPLRRTGGSVPVRPKRRHNAGAAHPVATCPTAISRIDERFPPAAAVGPSSSDLRGSVAVVGHKVVPEIASKSVRTAIQPTIRFAFANSGAAGTAIGPVWPRSMKRSAASGKAETPNVSVGPGRRRERLFAQPGRGPGASTRPAQLRAGATI